LRRQATFGCHIYYQQNFTFVFIQCGRTTIDPIDRDVVKRCAYD
jgi:hypothetical protein